MRTRGARKDTHTLTMEALRQQRTDARRAGQTEQVRRLTTAIESASWAHAYLSGRR